YTEGSVLTEPHLPDPDEDYSSTRARFPSTREVASGLPSSAQSESNEAARKPIEGSCAARRHSPGRTLQDSRAAFRETRRSGRHRAARSRDREVRRAHES